MSKKKTTNRTNKNSKKSRPTRSARCKVEEEPVLTPLHERFRDYTPEEILEIKKNVCIAHKCPYTSRVHWSAKNSDRHGSTYATVCNYILIAEHSRGCMPDVCQHWKDKNVKKQVTNRGLFSK